MYCQNNHLLAALINCKTTEKQYFAKVEGPKTMILVRGICAIEGELVGKKIYNPVKNNIIWQKRPTIIITTWDNRRGEKQKMDEGEMA